MKNSKNRSLAMLIASVLIFGSIGVFRRFIPVSSAALACFRGVCGSLFLLCVAKIRKRKVFLPIEKKRLAWLILSGAVMGLNWILLFEAYSYTTVATATLCYYMAPAIVTLLSPMLFHETLGPKKLFCVILAFIGMVLVSGVAENGLPAVSELKGVLLGLGAAVLYATVVLINKLTAGTDAFEKTVIQLLSAAGVLLPYVLASGGAAGFASLDGTAVVMLLIVGFLHTGVAYALYFGSIDGLSAQTVAVLSYLDPVTALILSAAVLREKMTVFGLVGAVLIVGAAVLSETEGRRNA